MRLCTVINEYIVTKKSQAKKRQRTNNDVYILVIAIQVTVVPPIEHSSSLQFYTKLRNALPDCDRYRKEKEIVQHHFVWIVPETFKSLELPPDVAGVQQHICTIESIMTGIN